MDNASRQAWSLSFCHNRLGSQSPHAFLDQIQDTERMPVPIGVSFFKRFCCLALPGAPNCEPCFGVAGLAPFCVPFECSVIVSASSAYGQAEGKKVLVQVLSGTAPRGTIRGRLFNRGLVPKWARFLLLVWLIFFFKHGAQSCGFSGLAFGCVFRARFWARLIDVCSQSTHFWAQNMDSK